MTNEDIKHNFNLCINWLKDKSNEIGNEPLYIGWGDWNSRLTWVGKEYCGYMNNITIKKNVRDEELNVSISCLGGYYTQTYGYEKDFIEKWEKSYIGTGMNCPKYRHTFDEISICEMEKFLKKWKETKKVVLDRIEEMKSLDNFEI